MSLTALIEHLPSLKDLIAPALVGALLWSVKKAGGPLLHRIAQALRSFRIKDLKKTKRLRADPFAIQKQISKESALFCAFILSAVISMGLSLVPVGRVAQTPSLTLIYFFYYTLPVVALEFAWLWQRDFVETLLEESARIGAGFRRVSPPRTQTERRTKARAERQAKIKARPGPKAGRKHMGRRVI